MATVVLPEIKEDRLNRLEPLYHVVLLDDDDHTYDYVVEMLVKVFKISETRAFRHAVEVDTEGRTTVFTGPLSEAEKKRDQIIHFGADWRLERSKGSMSAVLEPAEGPG